MKEEIMESILKYMDEKQDILYLRGVGQGIEQGIEQNQKNIIKALVAETDFDDAKIAHLVGVDSQVVEKIRKK